MRNFSLPLLALLAAFILSACSPHYNWRDYRSQDAQYTALFPDKPISHSRDIDLNGMKVKMTMTAVQIDGATFAIGSGEAPDEVQAQAALAAMRTALAKNIGAASAVATASASASVSASDSSAASAPAAASASATLGIETSGTQNGNPVLLRGLFIAKGKRFYQVIVMGPKAAMPAEQTDMFLTSFKPD